MADDRRCAETDYIVVGAGAAGCVVAARLAERGNSVMLLEAGGRDASPLFSIPGLGFMVSLDPRYNWMFKSDPVVDLDDRELTLLQGRVLGGSSSINGMMYNRGNPAEYGLWRELGCEGWGYEEVVPFFERAEAAIAGRAVGDEPLALPLFDSDLPIFRAFLDAAAARGFEVLDDLTAQCREGFGYYRSNIRGGRRMSAARAYLPSALRSGRLRLWMGALVARVVVEKGVATGVEVVERGRVTCIRARREVVLCGGAIKSPQLLLLSGIGPAVQLKPLGIDPIADSPLVGEGLQNHPCYRMLFSCREPASAYRYARPGRAALEGLRYLLTRRGALSRTVYGAGGYIRSTPDVEIPDIQIVLTAALMPPVTGARPRLLKMLPRQHGFTAVVYQGTPYSRGSVSLRSADPLASPRIDTQYFSDRRDIDTLITGMRYVRDIVRMPALASLGVEEMAPGSAVASEAELTRAIRAAAGTAYHQSGSCAMGDHPNAVVDPQLRVRGVEGLRVADASVIPRILNAGLHGPTLMIGEKAAELICPTDGHAWRKTAA